MSSASKHGGIDNDHIDIDDLDDLDDLEQGFLLLEQLKEEEYTIKATVQQQRLEALTSTASGRLPRMHPSQYISKSQHYTDSHINQGDCGIGNGHQRTHFPYLTPSQNLDPNFTNPIHQGHISPSSRYNHNFYHSTSHDPNLTHSPGLQGPQTEYTHLPHEFLPPNPPSKPTQTPKSIQFSLIPTNNTSKLANYDDFIKTRFLTPTGTTPIPPNSDKNDPIGSIVKRKRGNIGDDNGGEGGDVKIPKYNPPNHQFTPSLYLNQQDALHAIRSPLNSALVSIAQPIGSLGKLGQVGDSITNQTDVPLQMVHNNDNMNDIVHSNDKIDNLATQSKDSISFISLTAATAKQRERLNQILIEEKELEDECHRLENKVHVNNIQVAEYERKITAGSYDIFVNKITPFEQDYINELLAENEKYKKQLDYMICMINKLKIGEEVRMKQYNSLLDGIDNFNSDLIQLQLDMEQVSFSSNGQIRFGHRDSDKDKQMDGIATELSILDENQHSNVTDDNKLSNFPVNNKHFNAKDKSELSNVDDGSNEPLMNNSSNTNVVPNQRLQYVNYILQLQTIMMLESKTNKLVDQLVTKAQSNIAKKQPNHSDENMLKINAQKEEELVQQTEQRVADSQLKMEKLEEELEELTTHQNDLVRQIHLLQGDGDE
jgi:hypothetical protein